MAKVYFFGYGANRSKERMREILGKEPEGGYGAVIYGYSLTYQVLDQVPESPRKILQKVWGDSFKGYTMRKSGGAIAGVIWELDEEDFEKLKKWEFVDEGWKEMVSVQATTATGDNITIMTDKVPESQPIKEVLDGLNYENNLNADRRPEVEEDEYRIHEMEKVRKELAEFTTI